MSEGAVLDWLAVLLTSLVMQPGPTLVAAIPVVLGGLLAVAVPFSP